MKKLFITLAVTVITAFSIQGFGQGFTISGTIKGIENGKVSIQARGGNKYETGIRNGRFTIQGKTAYPALHTLRIEGVRGTAQIFLDNVDITFEGDKDNLNNSKVSGCSHHDTYSKFVELSRQFTRETQFSGIGDFVKENNKSIVSAYILATMAPRYEDTDRLEAAVKSLDSSLYNTNYVKAIQYIINTSKITSVGRMAMDFTQNDTEGKPVSLSDFRGQVVLIDFWAAWCRPCRAENPNLVQAYSKFKSKNFTVLGVSLDRDRTDWLEAIKKDGLEWTQVSDLKYWDNGVAKMYGIRSIPANILVGRDGRILAKNLRGDELHIKLNEILN